MHVAWFLTAMLLDKIGHNLIEILSYLIIPLNLPVIFIWLIMPTNTVFYVIGICILSFIHLAAMSGEKLLIRKLLEDYKKEGKIGRPVKNVKDVILVKYGLALIQILSLDEKNQILTVNVWAKYTWVDELLHWDPKNFSGVEEVRIPPNKIWTPDIVLYNYADERLIEKRDVMVIVNYNGRIIWLPPAILKSTCAIDISNFPFDYQTCHLKFGSWTYKIDKLDIHLYENFTEIDTKDYTPSNEWKILFKPARRFILNSTNDTRPELSFFLLLKRNSAYHAYLLVVPCVLLSSLTLVIFWLPPESSAKMILGMNIFVAFSLLLRLLAETTPSASTSVPYLGYYYCLNMILITLSTFLSIIVINLYFRCDKRKNLPEWLKKWVNLASRILGMSPLITSVDAEKLHLIKSEIRNSRNHARKQQQQAHQHQPNQYNMFNVNNTTGCAEKESRETIPTPLSPRSRQKFAQWSQDTPAGSYEMYHMNQQQQCAQESGNYGASSSRRSTRGKSFSRHNTTTAAPAATTITPSLQHQQSTVVLLEDNLSEIRKALRNLMTKIADKDRSNRIAREWRTVAMVLDRVFFWLYLATIILSGIILLLPRGPPQSQDEVLHKYANKYK